MKKIICITISILLIFASSSQVFAKLNTPKDVQTPPANLYLLTEDANINTSNSTKVYFAGKTFRIVGDPTTGVISPENTVTLLCEGSLGDTPFVDWYNNIGRKAYYKDSELDIFIKNAIKPSFPEELAIAQRVMPGKYSWGLDMTYTRDFILAPEDGDDYITSIWALTQKDAASLDPAMCKINKDFWLSSPGAEAKDGGVVYASGTVSSGGSHVSNTYAVRAALYLNLDNILFVSGNTNGKDRAEVGGSAVDTIAPNSGDDLKLTLYNANRSSFKVLDAYEEDGAFCIDFINANVGDNEYVSYFALDENNNVSLYGKLVNVNSNDKSEGTIVLENVDQLTGQTIYITNEQINENGSDYTSKIYPVTVQIPQSASIFSEGNMTIMLCAVCAAVLVILGLMISRKRCVSAGGSDSDNE